jgi:hypothetical protein
MLRRTVTVGIVVKKGIQTLSGVVRVKETLLVDDELVTKQMGIGYSGCSRDKGRITISWPLFDAP